MIIKTISVSSIKEAAYNPRKNLSVKDPAYQKIRKSIEQHGLSLPLVWNKRTGNLIGGHQRLKVIKAMGIKTVQVVVKSITLQKEKQLNIALNKVSGDWDKKKLKDVLLDIDREEIDYESIGFNQKEVEDLIINDDLRKHPEIEFAMELMEEHNYVVFTFDNSMDFNVIKDKFGIKSCKVKQQFEKGGLRTGLGRVIDGKKLMGLLEKIK